MNRFTIIALAPLVLMLGCKAKEKSHYPMIAPATTTTGPSACVAKGAEFNADAGCLGQPVSFSEGLSTQEGGCGSGDAGICIYYPGKDAGTHQTWVFSGNLTGLPDHVKSFPCDPATRDRAISAPRCQ